MSGAAAPAPTGGGVGGTTFSALSGIGSDLSVSVSFNIASELLDAARDEQLSNEELVSLILGFTVVASALQSAIRKALSRRVADAKKRARERVLEVVSREELRAAICADSTVSISPHVRARSNSSMIVDAQLADAAAAVSLAREAEQHSLAKLAERRSALDFVALATDIVQRILVAVSIQLLAASVRSSQPSRTARMVSLSGLAVFFVFVESLTHRVVI